MLSASFHKHEEKNEWAVTMTARKPDWQFLYSIAVFGNTLMEACGAMEEKLEEKEWNKAERSSLTPSDV